jgi:reductive dehalogenase
MIWGQPSSRVDERDTMFARMARRQGSPSYEEYYRRRPDLKAVDDRLRTMPDLLRPGGVHFDQAICADADRWFRRIDEIAPDPTLVTRLAERLTAAPDPTSGLQAAAVELGGVASGSCRVDSAFVYTHKGRFDRHYGQPIALDHASAFVFLVEMGADQMRRAPRAEAIRESARQYYRAAVIARTLESVLIAIGYSARSHYDAHYDVVLPPLAVAAGLGELGRHNLLIADRFGTRVRIGAITTDAPLRHVAPASRGVRHFCGACLKCADNCPSRALSDGAPEDVRGITKWPTHSERCYGYWRRVGTDCGICMAVCPFSHRDTWLHNNVRRLVTRAPWLAAWLVRADDLVYGREWPGRFRGERASRHAE